MNVIVEATVEHIDELAALVRRADRIEMESAMGLDTHTTLLLSLALSTKAYTWLQDGRVAAVFGVAPDPQTPGCGNPWMIGTAAVESESIWFLRRSRIVVNHLNDQYPLLENFVHPQNTQAIRWLRWCGFEFGEPEPYGINGDLFLPFFKERQHV